MVEVDVDMEYLAINDELDCVVLHDENGVMDDVVFVPEKSKKRNSQIKIYSSTNKYICYNVGRLLFSLFFLLRGCIYAEEL